MDASPHTYMSAEIDITDYFDTIRDFVEDLESQQVPTEKTEENATLAAYFDEELRAWFRKHEDIDPGGNSGEGIDLPKMNTDVKAPETLQSSSPASSPGEEILGIDHNILFFDIDITDLGDGNSKIEVERVKFIPKELTADHRVSKKAKELVEQYDDGSLTEDRFIERLHEITSLGGYMEISEEMIEEIKQGEFEQGVFTHSNALQFRFNYNMTVGEYSDKTEDIL